MHLHAHINVCQNSKRTNVDMLNENSLSTEKVITHTNNQSKYKIRLVSWIQLVKTCSCKCSDSY